MKLPPRNAEVSISTQPVLVCPAGAGSIGTRAPDGVDDVNRGRAARSEPQGAGRKGRRQTFASRNANRQQGQRIGGAPGTDRLTTGQPGEHIRRQWETLHAKLFAGICVPSPVIRTRGPGLTKPEFRSRNGERPRPAGWFGRLARTFVPHFWFQVPRQEVCGARFSAGRRKPHAGGVCSPRGDTAHLSRFGVRAKPAAFNQSGSGIHSPLVPRGARGTTAWAMFACGCSLRSLR